MKTRILTGGLLALMLLALAPALALADGATGVAVSPLTAEPDQTITVKGEVLGPNTEVEVRVVGNGEDVDLGEVQTNAEGDFTQEFRLPADLQPGTYQVRAIGEETATTTITVAGAPGGGAAPEEAAGGAGGEEGGAAMGAEPVIETRPLGQSIALVALFGVLAALGLFFAYLPTRQRRKA